MSNYSRCRAHHDGFVLKKALYVLKMLIKFGTIICDAGDDIYEK